MRSTTLSTPRSNPVQRASLIQSITRLTKRPIVVPPQAHRFTSTVPLSHNSILKLYEHDHGSWFRVPTLLPHHPHPLHSTPLHSTLLPPLYSPLAKLFKRKIDKKKGADVTTDQRCGNMVEPVRPPSIRLHSSRNFEFEVPFLNKRDLNYFLRHGMGLDWIESRTHPVSESAC